MTEGPSYHTKQKYKMLQDSMCSGQICVWTVRVAGTQCDSGDGREALQAEADSALAVSVLEISKARSSSPTEKRETGQD